MSAPWWRTGKVVSRQYDTEAGGERAASVGAELQCARLRGMTAQPTFGQEPREQRIAGAPREMMAALAPVQARSHEGATSGRDASTAPNRAMRSASAVGTTSPYDSDSSAHVEGWCAYRRPVIDDLATAPDPYPTYATLRDRGVHRAPDGRWTVARAADVGAALSEPRLVVPHAAVLPDALGRARCAMARFSDGADHPSRRAVTTAAMARITAEELAVAVRRQALAGLDTTGPVDVIALARTTTTVVLSAALGIAPAAGRVASVDVLANALAPRLGAPTDAAIVTTAVDSLVAAAPGATYDERINVVALLHQAHDATAGLVASALLAAQAHGVVGQAELVVREAARWDPPVQHTVRRASTPLSIGGAAIDRDDLVVVVLAAAGRDPAHADEPDRFLPDRAQGPLAFGAGAHECPGERAALAIAAGIVDAVWTSGRHVVAQPVVYERRANLRIPCRLVVQTPSPTAS
jgi:cytochrome P450